MGVYHENSCRYLKELQNTLLRGQVKSIRCIPFGQHGFSNAGGSLDDLKQQETRIRRGEESSETRRRFIVEVMYVQFSPTKGRKWLSAMQRSRRSYECKTSVKQMFCRYDWNVSLRNDSRRKWVRVLTRVKNAPARLRKSLERFIIPSRCNQARLMRLHLGYVCRGARTRVLLFREAIFE